MLLNPVQASTEGSLSSSTPGALEKVNQVISKYGRSAFHSKAIGNALSGSSDGQHSILSSGMDFEMGNAVDSGTGSAATGKQFTKSEYYFEPRALLKIRDANVQPTQGFQSVLRHVVVDSSAAVSGQYTILDLFNDYGTHTCAEVSLGGWMRMTVDYHSQRSVPMDRMEKAANNALGKAVVHAAPAASSSKSSVTTATGANSTDVPASVGAQTQSVFHASTEDGVAEVRSEWRGGQSGSKIDVFRSSLGSCSNSNWRIIDRNIEQCRGIWHWAHSDSLKLAICKEWAMQFSRSMKPGQVSSETIATFCRTAGTVEDFRNSLNLPPHPLPSALAPAAQPPESAPEPVPVPGRPPNPESPPGTTPGEPEDPTHAALRQGASMSSGASSAVPTASEISSDIANLDKAVNSAVKKLQRKSTTVPPGMPLPPSDPPPVAPPSGQPLGPTNVFLLSIRTSLNPGCGKNEKVYALVDNGSGELQSKDDNAASTGWQLLDIARTVDFKAGDVNEYTLAASGKQKFIPTRVCLMTSGAWCPDTTQPAVSVYSGMMLKGAASKIGTATGYTQFMSPAPQCQPIIPAR